MNIWQYDRHSCLSVWGDALPLGLDRQECLSYFQRSADWLVSAFLHAETNALQAHKSLTLLT
jgi:hypothetical protein